MTRLNVGNIRHPDATTDSITLTSGGDTQITGALGLGGATYGSSGQFLQSQGSGSAPQWATPAAGVDGLTWTASSNLTSSAGNTLTLPDSNSTYIVVAIRNVSGGSTATEPVGIRLGDGSLQTSGYAYGVSQGTNFKGENPGDRFCLTPETVSNPGNQFSGTLTLVKLSSGWSASWVLGANVGNIYTNVGGGTYTATSSIDRVQCLINTGLFDIGEFRVGYA